MTITPQIAAPLNTLPPYSISLATAPTVSTPAGFIGQLVWVPNLFQLWQNAGFEVGVGYLWTQVYPSSSSISYPTGSLYYTGTALEGFSLVNNLTMLGGNGTGPAVLSLAAGSGIDISQSGDVVTISTDSLPTTLPTGALYNTGTAIQGFPLVANLQLLGSASGAPAVISLVAGTNMSVTQTGTTITIANTYTPTTLPTGVQYYDGTTLSGINPTATLQFLGNNGSGVPSAATFVAGQNMSISQSGSNYTFASTGGGSSSGAVGVYSPVNRVTATLPSNVAVTTVYTTTEPALSAMQVIATVTITCQYPNSNGIGSVLQADAVVGYFCPAAQALGVQLAIYCSTTGTLPTGSYPLDQQGSCPNSFDNYSSSQLVAQVPSVQGQAITFTLAASVVSGTTATIDASAFSFVVVENVPNTQAIVSSNTYNFTSSLYTSATQAYSTTTSLLSEAYTKQYSNSALVVSGSIPALGVSANTSYFSSTGIYIATPSQLNASSPIVGFFGAGMAGTTISAPNGISISTPINTVIEDFSLGAGVYTLALGATYQSQQYFVQGLLGSIIVDEVLPLADGGAIQNFALPSLSTTLGTPYVTTLSPQYSTVRALGTWSVVTRAQGSTLVFNGGIGNNAITGNPEGELLFCFYTSNTPTATPAFTARVSAPASGSTAFNTAIGAWRFSTTSTAAEIPIFVYVGVASLTAANTVQAPYITAEFSEILAGSVTTGLTDVVAASGSYLTSSVSGSTATVGTQRATTSQAGIVALTASAPANTVVRVNNAGSLVATTAPFYPPFGTSLVLTFGGASVGVTYTNRSGIAACLSPYPIPTGATGQASPLFVPTVQIIMNISSKGTSTGTATITGMPVIPFVPNAASVGIINIDRYQGIAIPNNNRLGLQYVSGSSTLTFVQMPDNGGPAVALTNTAFTAPITFTATGIVFTLTAPTN
jgi:hypothetical protein